MIVIARRCFTTRTRAGQDRLVRRTDRIFNLSLVEKAREFADRDPKQRSGRLDRTIGNFSSSCALRCTSKGF
jgi:hypothetical protein